MRSKALVWTTLVTLGWCGRALAQDADSSPPGTPTSPPATASAPVESSAPLEVPAPSVDEPRTGRGRIIAGSILIGFAALNLATLPIVYSDFYHDLVRDGYDLSESEADDAVRAIGYVTIGQIVVEAAIGIPLLVSGLNAQKRHRAWKARRESGFAPGVFYSTRREGSRDYHMLSLAVAF